MTEPWHPWQAGDVAWVAVTDHPDYPKAAFPDTYGKCRTREECQMLCNSWNSYGGEWRWYPKEFVLQDGKEHNADDDDDSQLTLF